MRSQIETCYDCPHSGDDRTFRIWERYNWNTHTVEETQRFDDDMDDVKDIVLGWLQEEETYDNQDGEWTESGYVYFRNNETIEIRETKVGKEVLCGISGDYNEIDEDTDMGRECDVASDINELPIFERYNEDTKQTEKEIEIDEDDEDALEAAVRKLVLTSDLDRDDINDKNTLIDIWGEYDYYNRGGKNKNNYKWTLDVGYIINDYVSISFDFPTIYRTINKLGQFIVIRRTDV